jgi:hypothetical protein
VIDVADPFTPTEIDVDYDPGLLDDIVAQGDHAYVATRGDTVAFDVLDVTDPRAPIRVGRLTNESADRLAVQGDLVFAAAGVAGLTVIDVSDRQAPQVIARLPLSDVADVWGRLVCAGGDVVFVSTTTYYYVYPEQPPVPGLAVVDVTDPAQPTIIWSGAVDRHIFAMHLDGDILYVATSKGVEAYDVKEPESPVLIGGLAMPSAGFGLTVRGNHVYLANGGAGLQILPVQCSEPTPVELVEAEAVIDGDRVRIVWRTGLEVDHLGFNVHRRVDDRGAYQRINATLVRGSRGVGGARYEHVDTGVAFGHTYAYRLEAVGRGGDRQHFDLPPVALGSAPPPCFALHSPRPNPFNPSSRVGFEVPSFGPVSLIVYDAGGRRVRALIDGALASGVHSVAWDARDDRGRAVGSGVYFLRLQAAARSASIRLVLVK